MIKTTDLKTINNTSRWISFPLITVAYLAVNFFHIGSDSFIIYLNRFLVIPLAIGITVFSFILWKKTPQKSSNRVLWLGLCIGWGLWTIAETWFALADVLGSELPYPSWADIFWLLGYIPLYFSLIIRIRSLPLYEKNSQRVLKWFSYMILVGLAFYFTYPYIRDFDSSVAFESILNILYPVQDIILMSLVITNFIFLSERPIC